MLATVCGIGNTAIVVFCVAGGFHHGHSAREQLAQLLGDPLLVGAHLTGGAWITNTAYGVRPTASTWPPIHAMARYFYGEGFAYRHVGEQVAQVMQPAQAAQCSTPLNAKPAAALEHPRDRCRQLQVANPSGEGFANGDHQPGAGEAALLLLNSLQIEAAQEMAPEDLRHSCIRHFTPSSVLFRAGARAIFILGPWTV